MKTKAIIEECQTVLLRFASNRRHWGRAKARPYIAMAEEEKRQQGCRTPKAPRQAGLEVAW
jgi:hypothetical protein